jgi:ABC-type glycerol-3-phosphate transport system permease component
MAKELTKKWVITLIGWLVAIFFFFPIFRMTITAFKTEKGAISLISSFGRRWNLLPMCLSEVTTFIMPATRFSFPSGRPFCASS